MIALGLRQPITEHLTHVAMTQRKQYSHIGTASQQQKTIPNLWKLYHNVNNLYTAPHSGHTATASTSLKEQENSFSEGLNYCFFHYCFSIQNCIWSVCNRGDAKGEYDINVTLFQIIKFITITYNLIILGWILFQIIVKAYK